MDTIKDPANYDNIYNRTLASDSLSSSFVIFIKKEVKKHKHATHTENVYILDGEGEMLLGDKTFKVKKGDIIFTGTPKGVAAVKENDILEGFLEGKQMFKIQVK